MRAASPCEARHERWGAQRVGTIGALASLCALACNSGAPPAPTATASARLEEPPPALTIVELPSAKPEPRFVGAAQVLVAYRGAERAPTTVTRSRDDARQRAAEALAKLRGGAELASVARDYSDDPVSRDAGGAIGNFERYAMPSAFADAAFALDVGQLSGVVETPRGFHVIKRLR